MCCICKLIETKLKNVKTFKPMNTQNYQLLQLSLNVCMYI